MASYNEQIEVSTERRETLQHVRERGAGGGRRGEGRSPAVTRGRCKTATNEGNAHTESDETEAASQERDGESGTCRRPLRQVDARVHMVRKQDTTRRSDKLSDRESLVWMRAGGWVRVTSRRRDGSIEMMKAREG